MGWTNEGLVEMRDGGDVPRVAGQGTRAETVGVIGKMGNDHFDELQGKLGDRGRVCWRGP